MLVFGPHLFSLSSFYSFVSELKERSPEDEREIRWFWRERFSGFGFHERRWLSLSILGVGTLVERGLLANFKSTLVRPQESMAETQPKLQPASLRLSAMISQYFTTADSASSSFHRQ